MRLQETNNETENEIIFQQIKKMSTQIDKKLIEISQNVYEQKNWLMLIEHLHITFIYGDVSSPK